MLPKIVTRLGLRLTPQGHLVSEQAEDSPDLEDKIAARLVEAFGQGSGAGLMWLGAEEVTTSALMIAESLRCMPCASTRASESRQENFHHTRFSIKPGNQGSFFRNLHLFHNKRT